MKAYKIACKYNALAPFIARDVMAMTEAYTYRTSKEARQSLKDIATYIKKMYVEDLKREKRYGNEITLVLYRYDLTKKYGGTLEKERYITHRVII